MNRYSAFLVTLLLALCLTGAEGPIVAGGAGTAGSVTPVDPASLPWGIERIQAPQAWARTIGSQDVVVAVIDAGIDTTVPQLQGKIWTNPGEIPGNGIDDDRNGYVDDVHGWDFRDDDGYSAEIIGVRAISAPDHRPSCIPRESFLAFAPFRSQVSCPLQRSRQRPSAGVRCSQRLERQIRAVDMVAMGLFLL